MAPPGCRPAGSPGEALPAGRGYTEGASPAALQMRAPTGGKSETNFEEREGQVGAPASAAGTVAGTRGPGVPRHLEVGEGRRAPGPFAWSAAAEAQPRAGRLSRPQGPLPRLAPADGTRGRRD